MRSRINNSSDPARRSGSKVTIKSQNLNKAKHALKQPVEDDYLDTDSEVDEFAAEGAQAGPSGSSDEEGDPASDEDDEEEEGVGLWQPDDWGGGEAEGSGSGSDSESENEEVGQNMCLYASRDGADGIAATGWRVIPLLLVLTLQIFAKFPYRL